MKHPGCWTVVLVLCAALFGSLLAFIIYDTPKNEPVAVVSPPFNTPIEDTAHYVTGEGVLIDADN